MFQATRVITLGALLASAFVSAAAQNPPSGTAPQGQPTDQAAPSASGAQTAGPHAPQLDAQHRPITAGGFVKTGPIVFEDISEKAGLTGWTHKMGTPDKSYIIETKGSG